MENINKLKENHPELVEEYSKMDKEQLLDQICSEVLDLHKMQERVQVFMGECTLNMSNTTYTPESIRSLVNDKQEHDINQFCYYLMEMETEDIMNELNKKAEEYGSK